MFYLRPEKPGCWHNAADAAESSACDLVVVVGSERLTDS